MKTNMLSAEDRASITSPNPADRAAPVARSIIETGAVPRDASPFWRSHFTHGYGKVPADIRKPFGLGHGASWGDVLRAIDAKLDPKSTAKPHELAGWDEGPSAASRNQPGTEARRRARWQALAQEVAEGQHVGKQAAWDSLVFSTRGRARARMVLQALGLPASGKVQIEPADLEGRAALVEIRPAEYQSPAGDVVRRNEVPYDGFRSLPSESAPAPTRARPAPGAAVDENDIPF